MKEGALTRSQPDPSSRTKQNEPYFPLSVPDYRFDQRNEMFKRRTWDEQILAQGQQFYTEVRFREKYGFRKLDFALRNASWSIEHGFAFGNQRGNYGLYSWTHVSEKNRRFIKAGGPVSDSPEVNARNVKRAARFLGADLVGICYAHPNLVYSHELDLIEKEHRAVELPEGCTHAIVMAVEMDYETSLYSPDGIAGASTGLGYTRQAVLANLVATFIRGLGFRAIPSGNDTALSVPLAIAAGLGELGRHGLLITEEFGPRVRLCKVFTDLPLQHDDYRPFGVTEFCRTCVKCAARCPSQAIPYGEPTMEGPTSSNHSGVSKWYIDPEKCFLFWVRNWMDCNHCVAFCPFNKPKGRLHDLVRFLIRRFPVFNRLIVRLDDLFGYGKQIPTQSKDFWETC
jgi:reductive dehalogenase